MIKLHTTKHESALGVIHVRILFIDMPLPLEVVYYYMEMYAVTTVALVDPMIVNPQICKWVDEYMDKLEAKYGRLPVYGINKHPDIDYLDIVI